MAHNFIFCLKSIICVIFGAASFSAAALDFRNVSVPKAVLYDAPSTEATKLWVVSQGYPVEIIVNLNNWIKVRDHLGVLSWIEAKHLTDKKQVIVTADVAEIRKAEAANAPLLATVSKDVLLEVLANQNNGWIKVKHRDGVIGFVQATALWGLSY